VIAEVQYGTSVRADADGKGVAVIRMNNINASGGMDLTDIKYADLSENERKHYALEPGDILFNRTNSKELVGKTGLWRGEVLAVAASYLIRVRVDLAQVRPEFIWTYMNSRYIKQVLFDKCRRAIGMANINAKELRALPLIIPPRQMQQAFVTQLEHAESLVKRGGSARVKLERLFSVLLHRAFTGDLIRLTDIGAFVADEVVEQFNANEFMPFPESSYAPGPLHPYADNATRDALGE